MVTNNQGGTFEAGEPVSDHAKLHQQTSNQSRVDNEYILVLN